MCPHPPNGPSRVPIGLRPLAHWLVPSYFDFSSRSTSLSQSLDPAELGQFAGYVQDIAEGDAAITAVKALRHRFLQHAAKAKQDLELANAHIRRQRLRLLVNYSVVPEVPAGAVCLSFAELVGYMQGNGLRAYPANCPNAARQSDCESEDTPVLKKPNPVEDEG